MSTELGRSEGNARGVHRILRAQIDDAQSELSGSRVSDESVHAARKSLKKARATLRLIRDAIPTTAYQRENRALRDAARPLSAARDARVMLDTLDRLEKLYGPAAKRSIPAELRDALERDQVTARRAMGSTNGARKPRATSLAQVRGRISRLQVTAHGWEELGSGLKRVYRNGRRAMKQAKRTPTPDCLHEWRKQTKHLWHQLQVLQPLWPGTIGELADQAHKLSDYLGDDHDLAVLREKVAQRPELFQKPGGPGALLALIDRCQRQLREKAFLAGGRIYDERPRDLVARFSRYWQRWQAEKTPAGGQAATPP
jgi:CHAD domain-containing protein